MIGILHVVDGAATFANANVYLTDVVAEKVAEKVAGSTHRRLFFTMEGLLIYVRNFKQKIVRVCVHVCLHACTFFSSTILLSFFLVAVFDSRHNLAI